MIDYYQCTKARRIFSSSRGIELELEAGLIRVRSSAFLRNKLWGEAQQRSVALRTNSAVLTATVHYTSRDREGGISEN